MLHLRLAILFTVIGFVTVAFPQKPDAHSQLEIIPEAIPESYKMDNMRIDLARGIPVALYRLNYPLKAATPEEMARQYLTENSHILGIRSEKHILRHTTTRETPGGFHVRFQQFEQNYPVYKADLVVNINRRNQATFVMNSFQPTAFLKDATPAITLDAAEKTAQDYLSIEGRIHYRHQETVVYHNDNSSILAHKITLVPAEELIGDWEILVDARTGEIVRVEDKAVYGHSEKQHVNGSGWVFDPDPLTHARKSYQTGGQFGDNSDANTDSLTAHTVERTLLDITLNGGNYELNGPYANIVDAESPFRGTFSQSSSNWHNLRNAAAFEAVNVYYHIDKSMRYINETLGFTLMPFQYSGGVRSDPHGLGGSDNSHYIPSTGVVAWGEGGVDDAEDADVILHELGHGLHDWLTNGSLSQVNGLSEGCGDYWANSYNRATGFWTSADPQYYWTFQWDGHNEFWNGRITNYSATYPGGLTGAIHTDGQIWATALMQIWDDIGRTATDANFLEALSMTNSATNQEDAAQAFIQADIDLHGGANLAAIELRFTQRGYDITIPGPPAMVSVSPTSISTSVLEGGSSTVDITISNTAAAGSKNLNWSVSPNEGVLEFSDGRQIPVKLSGSNNFNPSFKLAKDAADWRKGPQVLEGSGGPDLFGYTWIDSDEAGGPTYNWQDISSSGTSHNLGDDDYATVSLPFSFPFYGNNYSTIYISTNGLLGFNTSNVDEYFNQAIPNGNTPNNYIAPFWDDLNPNLGGDIYHYYNSTSGEFIVQWDNLQHYGGSLPYTFQVILTANGDILFQYEDMQGGVTSATVGIENSDASIGLQMVFNSAYIQDDLAVLIQNSGEDCPWLSTDPSSGIIAPGNSSIVTATFDAASLSAGTYQCTLVVATDDPDSPEVNIPVEFTVTNAVTLLGTLNPRPSAGYSDCWGWTAPDGREYALLGVNNGTSVIDITTPASPQEISFIPGPTSQWRDIKTYQNYAYVVNETSGGMHIIDLSNLPTSATLAATFTGFSTMHNLFIDTTRALLYASPGSGNSPCIVYSLANPTSPSQLSTFGGHNHDSWSLGNLVFLSAGNSGTVDIYDLSDPASPSLETQISVPSSGYVHNAWGSLDGNYLMTTEETSGKTMKFWDISDLDNISLTDQVLGSSGLAHNTHIKGDFAYVSHYADGLIIFDITDPDNVAEVGDYDTHAATSGFSGAWGAFPFFPSGNVIISDQSTGLYIVDFAGDDPAQLNLTGQILYADTAGNGDVAKPVAGITVDLKQSSSNVKSTSTDAAGNFQLNGITPGSNFSLHPHLSSTPAGSVTTPTDAMLTFNDFLGISTLSGTQRLSADVDSSLTITPADALLIFQRYLGNITQYTMSDWRIYPATFAIEANSNSWQSTPEEITYGNLTTDMPNQDFNALLKGDVNMDWAPAASAPSIAKQNSNSPTLKVNTIVNDDQGFSIQIHLLNANAENRAHAFGVDVLYNRQQIRLGDVDWQPLVTNRQFQTGSREREADASAPPGYDGRLRLGGFTTANNPLENSGVLVKIDCYPLHDSDVVQSIDLILANMSLALDAGQSASAAKIGKQRPISEVRLVNLEKRFTPETLPSHFALDVNYPNPFNPRTHLRYQLAEAANVSVVIYNSLGQKISQLLNHKTQSAGQYELVWDGTNRLGENVASGIYYYRLDATYGNKHFSRTRKMLLMR